MPDLEDEPCALVERIERIIKRIKKTNNLRTLYGILRAELGTIKRQYPEWIKDLEMTPEVKELTDIIVEERSKLPMGYTSWKQILRIDYDTLKKVKKHTFRNDLRIRVEENAKK